MTWLTKQNLGMGLLKYMEVQNYMKLTSLIKMLTSSWCIPHAQIQTVTHSSSSNSSCIAFCHHSNKFLIIDRSILKLTHQNLFIQLRWETISSNLTVTDLHDHAILCNIRYQVVSNLSIWNSETFETYNKMFPDIFGSIESQFGHTEREQ